MLLGNLRFVARPNISLLQLHLPFLSPRRDIEWTVAQFASSMSRTVFNLLQYFLWPKSNLEGWKPNSHISGTNNILLISVPSKNLPRRFKQRLISRKTGSSTKEKTSSSILLFSANVKSTALYLPDILTSTRPFKKENVSVVTETSVYLFQGKKKKILCRFLVFLPPNPQLYNIFVLKTKR